LSILKVSGSDNRRKPIDLSGTPYEVFCSNFVLSCFSALVTIDSIIIYLDVFRGLLVEPRAIGSQFKVTDFPYPSVRPIRKDEIHLFQRLSFGLGKEEVYYFKRSELQGGSPSYMEVTH